MLMAKKSPAHVKRHALSRIFLWLFLPLLMLIVCLPQAQARPKSMEELAAIMGKLVETGVSYGAIPSLYRPRYDRVMDADLNTIPMAAVERIEVLSDDADAETLVGVIVKSAGSGTIGDGKVWVAPLDSVTRVRTGETGSAAI